MNDYYEQQALWDRDLTPQEKYRIHLVAQIIPKDVETILDAGCGNGAISNYLEGYTIKGIDRSEEALKYFKHDKSIGSLESLPFEDGAFDLVLCSDVLEHLPKEVFERAINELQRVSKKYLLIISPNAEDLEASYVKCAECSTIFNINWHLRSLGLNDLIEVFKQGYSPMEYTYFGDKWANDPMEKYRLKRSSDTGYKSWEQAVCPLCQAQQKANEKHSNTAVDVLLNRHLEGFYNHSTEVMILFAKTAGKQKLPSSEEVSPKHVWLLSKEPLHRIINASRQAVDCTRIDAARPATEAYPQCGYLLQNAQSHWIHGEDGYALGAQSGQNRGIVCIPFTSETQELVVELHDMNTAIVYVNLYDLADGYVRLGSIELSGRKTPLSRYFTIPPKLIPPNEGLMIEVIIEGEDSKMIPFVSIHCGMRSKTIELSEGEVVHFRGEPFYRYCIPADRIRIDENYYLNAAIGTYVYDPVYHAYFWNTTGSFEIFRSGGEMTKVDFDDVSMIVDNRKEIQYYRDEFERSRHEIEQNRSIIYLLSNNFEALQNRSLKRRMKRALRSIYHTLKYTKKSMVAEPTHADPSRKHLVVLTPDVKIDRRTVQMCQSLIEHHDLRCTIIAALEGNDGFVGDHLIVKRIFPNEPVGYDEQKLTWHPDTRFDLESFYWLHSRYLSRALQEDADIMMCCDLPVLPAATYAAKIKNIPLIYDAHELYPEQAIFPNEKRELYSRVEQEFIRYPDLVITVNQSIACEMAKRYSIAEPSVILNALDAPEGFDIDYNYDYFREQIPISPEQKIVLFQGGYSPNRNLELFVASAKYLKRSDIVLVLMGFGIFQEELEGIARTDGTLKNSVFFFPAVDQSVLLEYSASADVGIIPYPHIDLNSYYCTPNKLFEFIQAGLPMIANDSPELNRFVRENDIGYSRKIETAEDIADMIDTYFAQNVDYAPAMRKARENISWAVEERKLAEILKGILV